MPDQRYLEWHGSQWRVRVKVPQDLRHVFGKGKITVPLHTDSLAKANQLKWAEVAKIKASFEAARKGIPDGGPLMAEAAQLRLQKTINPTAHQSRLASRIDELGGDPEIIDFTEVASGISTPISHHLSAFTTHKAYRIKSAADLERVLGWLKVWLKRRGVPLYVEDIDRKLAGAFLEEFLLRGRSTKKVSSYLGFLREYWRWLKQRGHATENPWLDQDLPKAPRRTRELEPDKGKRAYTDDELAKLLYGTTSGYMPDLMRIAYLSGMRLEEICQLQIKDCTGGNFHVWQGKTANAIRDIPIHTDLKATIEKRSKGKAPEAHLFDELPDMPASRDTRSDPASKRFTRYRREVGVDERPNGKAKSNVDFHSFRRTFIRKARDAMEKANGAFNPWTLADVVGHDDEGVKDVLKLTMVDYPGAASRSAKRALVESVKLPEAPRK
ncbi:MAG: tyrosine-type recombinase/integrase [Pelagibacterium sp.]|uniref:DUF6538 domain-containing protein n=1 Tax=Pelagibacterium sp. TaxID=1967288 RepID=UPI0032ED3BA7